MPHSGGDYAADRNRFNAQRDEAARRAQLTPEELAAEDAQKEQKIRQEDAQRDLEYRAYRVFEVAWSEFLQSVTKDPQYQGLDHEGLERALVRGRNRAVDKLRGNISLGPGLGVMNWRTPEEEKKDFSSPEVPQKEHPDLALTIQSQPENLEVTQETPHYTNIVDALKPVVEALKSYNDLASYKIFEVTSVLEARERPTSWSPSTGISQQGEVFTLNRDGAQSLNLPIIKATVDQTRSSDGYMGSVIELGPTFDASTSYNFSVLPGIMSVRVWGDGRVQAWQGSDFSDVTLEQSEVIVNLLNELKVRIDTFAQRLRPKS